MRNVAAAVAALAVLLSVASVDATEAPKALTPEEAKFGEAFQPLASRFGFSVLVRSSRTETGLLFEYRTEEEALEDWHYRASVVLARVGKTWEEGAVVLPRYVAALQKQIRVVNQSTTIESTFGHVTYLDYEVGEGAGREHNLSVIWQAMEGVVGVFRAQRRPDRFGPHQIEQFRTLALDLAQSPTEPEP